MAKKEKSTKNEKPKRYWISIVTTDKELFDKIEKLGRENESAGSWLRNWQKNNDVINIFKET